MPERDATIVAVVQHCVQLAERQPLDTSQARILVGRGDVLVDGEMQRSSAAKLAPGTWELTVRGRKHLVVVHGIELE